MFLQVCITDVNANIGAVTIKELQTIHGSNNVMFISCDVTKDADFESK